MQEILRRLGIEDVNPGAWAGQAIAGTTGEVVTSTSPGNGEALASIQLAGVAEYEKVVEAAQSAFERWRMLPAPKRGEIVRQMGDAMREHKDDLGTLVTLEVEVLSEGLGEVQRVSIWSTCGRNVASALRSHALGAGRTPMYEQWHPLGVVGCITAQLQRCLGMECHGRLGRGDAVIWKPSLKARSPRSRCPTLDQVLANADGLLGPSLVVTPMWARP